MGFHQLGWRALLFHWHGLRSGTDFIQKEEKKSVSHFLFLNVFAPAMPFLPVPEELKVSSVQYNCIFSIHRLQSPTCLCAGELAGLLLPAPLLAEFSAGLGLAAAKAAMPGQEPVEGCVCQCPVLPLASAAGLTSRHGEGAGLG